MNELNLSMSGFHPVQPFTANVCPAAATRIPFNVLF
jgi:hypothetical protein